MKASCLTIPLLLCVFLSIQFPSACTAQVREWRAKSGHKVQGEMVNLNETSIALSIPNRDKPVVVAIDQLAPSDQKYAKIMWLDQQDRLQYRKVVDHLRSIQDKPRTVQRLLIEIHNAVPESPYAGLWAAVALSHGSNEHSRAAVLLKQVLSRIEKQHKVDPHRHMMTLTSVKNNLAVCMVKDRKGDSAAARLAEAIEARPTVPPVVQANAQLLNEVTSDPNSIVTFSRGSRERLMRSLAMADTPGAGTKLKNGWHYSLDFDLPPETAGAMKEEGVDAPRPELQLLAQGTGFVVAPGLVMTSRRVVETTNYNGPKLLTIITNPLASDMRGEIVDDVMIESTRSIASSATRSTMTDDYGDVANAIYTNYSYVRSPTGHSGAELAVLRVPNLAVKPLAIAKDSPARSTPVRILGYGRGQNAIRAGLRGESGLSNDPAHISSSTSGFNTGSRAIHTTARVLGGNRGGPVVDENNTVVGIAFDTPSGGTTSAGVYFGASELRRWFYKHVQTASLLDPLDDVDPMAEEMHLAKATLPVLCWGLKQNTTSPIFSMVTDSSRTGGSIYIRDGWCLACDGKGFMDCRVRGCNKGVVTGRRRTIVGSSAIGGDIAGSTSVRQKCSACRGAGGRRCPHCTNGRLK